MFSLKFNEKDVLCAYSVMRSKCQRHSVFYGQTQVENSGHFLEDVLKVSRCQTGAT